MQEHPQYFQNHSRMKILKKLFNLNWIIRKSKTQQTPSNRTPHHSYFAHTALREIVQNEPMPFFSAMVSLEQDYVLQDIWQQVREKCDKEGMPTMDISQVECLTCKVHDYPAVILSMPEPTIIGEAFYIAVVLLENDVGYYTLNLAVNNDDPVLCKWYGDERKVLGEVPEARLEDFIRAVRMRVE